MIARLNLAAGSRVFARRSPLSAFWGVVAALIFLAAAAAPAIAPYDPLESDFMRMQVPPDAANWFGTDQIGRDTLSRVIHGSRVSLTVALFAVLIGTTLGSFWGLASGYFGGWFDIASQRAIEFFQAFPDLILAMAIAMALGSGTGTVIIAIAITRIPFGGRVIRSVVLSIKETAYVEAARGIGASHMRIMLRHILPQCVAPYLILATTHLGVAIIIEASLGFLGVGVPPPTPTWGQHAGGRAQFRPRAALVAVCFSRACHYGDGARIQPARRRRARFSRSTVCAAPSDGPAAEGRPDMKIDVISDTVCPWCYIGKRRLERALEGRDEDAGAAEIAWHPFELNPDMPAEGMDRETYLALKFGGPPGAEKVYGAIAEAAGGRNAVPSRRRVSGARRTRSIRTG